MDSKELRKLRRSELLELLLLQTKEMERLREQLAKAEAELTERKLKIASIGNLADAVIQINGVMEAAQAAADQYLENIIAMEEETRVRCAQALQMAGISEESKNNREERLENINETADGVSKL